MNHFEVLLLEKLKPKTKEAVRALNKIVKKEKNRRKILLILPDKIENAVRAVRNIAGIKIIQANLLNTYEVLNGGTLILTKSSIGRLKEVFL